LTSRAYVLAAGAALVVARTGDGLIQHVKKRGSARVSAIPSIQPITARQLENPYDSTNPTYGKYLKDII
jgi:hypothetical protein